MTVMIRTWLILFLLIAHARFAFAYDGVVDNSACQGVSFTVTGIQGGSGFGGHIATDPYSNGYGGAKAECHLAGNDQNVLLLCYDGYISNDYHADIYRMDLGPRAQIRSVKLTILRDAVIVVASKVSHNPYNSTQKPYSLQSIFPLRASSGFCRESRIYYQVNGVLSGTPSRGGSGYSVDVSSL